MGQIFVLATTNRPEHVDAALRRPGRFDQVVWMGLPDERGRADIFEHYLRRLKLGSRLASDTIWPVNWPARPQALPALISPICGRHCHRPPSLRLCPRDSDRQSGLGDLRENEGECLRASGHVDLDLVFEYARHRAHLAGSPCVGEEFGTWLRHEWNILRS